MTRRFTHIGFWSTLFTVLLVAPMLGACARDNQVTTANAQDSGLDFIVASRFRNGRYYWRLHANQPPAISNIAGTSTVTNQSKAVAFSIYDRETALACNSKYLKATSSNPNVVLASNVTFAGTLQACRATITPVADASGLTTLTVTVSDGSLTASRTFTFAVDPAIISTPTPPANQAPIARNSSITATEHNSVSGVLVATDADSSSLTFSLTNNATKGTVLLTDKHTGAFTYTPSSTGTDSFSFRANDGFLDSNTAVVTVTINPVTSVPPTGNRPPEGLYHACFPSNASCLAELDDMQKGGFQFTINYSILDDTDANILKYMARLELLGLKTYWDMSQTSFRTATESRIQKLVNLVKSSPATAGYYVGDEDNVPAAKVEQNSAWIKKYDPDPTHLTIFIHFYQIDDCMVMARKYASPSVDGLGLDMYPLYGGRPTSDVATCSKKGQEYDTSIGKRWWAVLQAFKGSDENYGGTGNYPTLDQLYCMHKFALDNSKPFVVIWWWYGNTKKWGRWDDLVKVATGSYQPLTNPCGQ